MLRFVVLCLCYGFLYVPMCMVVLYSFNESRISTVWARFSLKWYKSLLANNLVLDAIWNSLSIATISASIAVILGTIAAISVRRIRFKTKTLLSTMITTPLVMPDIVAGISLLVMFVGIERLFHLNYARGFWTITIGHITLSMAYVFVVVDARIKDFDRSLEEAAMDLGATPFKAFIVVTMPIIMPSLVSGWLLSFALSLDDIMIANFLSGPQATTLPMLVFSNIRQGVSPEINALATIIVLVLSVVVVGLALALNKKKSYAK